MVEIYNEKTFALADAAPMVAFATSDQHSGTGLSFAAQNTAVRPTDAGGDVSGHSAWSPMV